MEEETEVAKREVDPGMWSQKVILAGGGLLLCGLISFFGSVAVDLARGILSELKDTNAKLVQLGEHVIRTDGVVDRLRADVDRHEVRIVRLEDRKE